MKINTVMAEQTIHQGRNIRRFREMLGWKQDALAYALGDQWNQQKVSYLGQREVIDNAILEDVAKVLKVPAEAIKNFSDEAAINIISGTVNNHDHATGNSLFSYYPTVNPIEKLVEVIEENKKLYAALLREKDEKLPC